MESYGKLELIVGNMFSGKSSELIRRINREKSINKKILVINFICDNRYSINSVVTHDNLKINCLKLEKLSDISENIIQQYDSFFIDEGQFFQDLYDIVLKLVDTYKKHVVVSGLDGDFNRKQFGDIIKLVPMCETIDKLTAYCSICSNGTSAPFTKKKNANNCVIDKRDIDKRVIDKCVIDKRVIDKRVIDIGGIDKYIPVCRYHYFNES